MLKRLKRALGWLHEGKNQEDDLGLKDSAWSSIRAVQHEAYRRGLEDQASALGHQYSMTIWGHPPQALILAMRSLGYGWKERYAALRSFGLTASEIQVHHRDDTTHGHMVLTASQRKSLDGRIKLYRSEV